MANYMRRNATRNQRQVFGYAPTVRRPRSRFNRSHGHTTTFDGDYLIPVIRDMLLPGDTINLKMKAFVRMADLVRPFFTNVTLSFHCYVIPIRLVFPLIEKMFGAQDNPGDSTSYVFPTMTSPSGGYAHDDLQAYWGVRQGVAGLTHHCLFDRAYNLTWKEHYRDQDLDDSPVIDTGEAASDPADHVLLKRRKYKDYFTAARPWLQKGTAVSLPLGTSAPLSGFPLMVDSGLAPTLENSGGSPTGAMRTQASSGEMEMNGTGWGTNANLFWTNSELSVDLTQGATGPVDLPYADLTAATAATLDELREAIAIQRRYEKDARSGTRFTEIIKNTWGVDSPDQRLQRPEYIGGADFNIYVNPIAQTSQTSGANALGNLAAQGATFHETRPIVRSIYEPSLLLGLISTRVDLVYQQRLPREMTYSTRWDWHWPEFEHLSEQAILNKEIFAQGTSADDEVFGYTGRYNEWRTKESMITGKFNSDDSANLDEWTLAQDFDNLPTLSSEFVEEDAPYDRVVTVTSEPEFKGDFFFDYICVRPISLDATPGLPRI